MANAQITTRMVPKNDEPDPLELDDDVAAMMMFRTILTPTATRVHHQYSLRLARPEKAVYFLKNRWIAAGNGAP